VPSWITSTLQQPFISGIIIGSRSVMRVLYTFSFAANLFRKLRIKFQENRPSFAEDITKNILVSFFPDTV